MIGWMGTGRLTAVLTAALVAAAGCTSEPGGGPGSGTTSATGTSSPASPGTSSSPGTASSPAPAASSTPPRSGSASTAPARTPNLGAPQVVARGLDVPWGLAFLPGGDALVGERETGRILRLTPGGTPRQVYDVPGVAASGEGGLLGIAVSPTFARDNLVYAYYTGEQDNRIVRFRLNAAAEPQVIFDGIAKASFHNGGRIAFGPDGMLYVGTGDAGDTEQSQDPSSPSGKILRLSPDGAPARGNPTAGSAVYSLGHRNVQGLAWDSAGRLFATEFGQNQVDEVNLIQPGRNYGWPLVEGIGDTDGGRFTNPLLTWSTDDASPSGMAIAGTTAYVAALRGERLWSVPLNGTTAGEPRAEFRGRYGRLRTVVTAPDGSLWLTTSNTDGRGNPRDDDDRILRFPAR